MRLMECLRLRVKDIDFGSNQITVREVKSDTDRITIPPELVTKAPVGSSASVKTIRDRDLAEGYGRILMPNAIDRKCPKARAEWGWQFVFSQMKRWVNARTGEHGRHHVDESIFGRALPLRGVKPG
jgi:integrase